MGGKLLPVLSFGSIEEPTSTSLPLFPTLVLHNSSTSTSSSYSQLPPLPSSTSSAHQPSKKGSTSLKGGEPSTSSSHSTSTPTTPQPDLSHLARTVLKAKRIAVVCGAGISTASGIPDFRSQSGLFESLKRQYPDAKLSSGKDLFDVGLFSSEQNASIFYNMIAELRKQTDQCQPTEFHRWLKSLDDEGKLFRVYTQNIDSLEERAGLSYGLGDTSLPLPPRRLGDGGGGSSSNLLSRSPSKPSTTTTTSSNRSTPPPPLTSSFPPTCSQTSTNDSIAETEVESITTSLKRSSSSTSSLSSLSSLEGDDDEDDQQPSQEFFPPLPISSQQSTTNTTLESQQHSTIPKVIPLHGHLATLTCTVCQTTYPLEPFLPLLSQGQSPLCPSCQQTSLDRQSRNKRSLPIGTLKPDVVLYGEVFHRDGERVGEICQRDLSGGKRPDLLLVVGTTLKVKGTKRLVRELSKVIKPMTEESSSDDEEESEIEEEGRRSSRRNTKEKQKKVEEKITTSTRKKNTTKPDPIHTIFLNKEFPGGGKEWQGIFDVWVRGDIQEFVEAVKREGEVMEREEKEREVKRNEKRKVGGGGKVKSVGGAGGVRLKGMEKNVVEAKKKQKKGKESMVKKNSKVPVRPPRKPSPPMIISPFTSLPPLPSSTIDNHSRLVSVKIPPTVRPFTSSSTTTTKNASTSVEPSPESCVPMVVDTDLVQNSSFKTTTLPRRSTRSSLSASSTSSTPSPPPLSTSSTVVADNSKRPSISSSISSSNSDLSSSSSSTKTATTTSRRSPRISLLPCTNTTTNTTTNSISTSQSTSQTRTIGSTTVVRKLPFTVTKKSVAGITGTRKKKVGSKDSSEGSGSGSGSGSEKSVGVSSVGGKKRRVSTRK